LVLWIRSSIHREFLRLCVQLWSLSVRGLIVQRVLPLPSLDSPRNFCSERFRRRHQITLPSSRNTSCHRQWIRPTRWIRIQQP
jgi:hypothetical protein